MNELNTVDIKGKAYVLVNERIKYFRAIHQGYSMTTNIIHLDDIACVLQAEIRDQTGKVVAQGLAREVNGDSFINKTSYVENCETSAWGRALANFGIGVDASVASAEEVLNAMANQGDKKPEPKPTPMQVIKDAYEGFIKDRKADIPEHFSCDYELFKTELKTEFKKQTPNGKQKGFEWTAESVKPFVLALDITKILKEENADIPSD